METKKQFMPFDRVIVRYADTDKWICDLYSHHEKELSYLHVLVSGRIIDEHNILPYEGNEHLVGTSDEPEEEIELKEGEKVLCSDHIDRLESGRGRLENFDGVVNNRIYVKNDFSGISYIIRFSDFNPNDMEETCKHILCVKNGKIVKYKE